MGWTGLDLRALGIPDEASYVRRYEETSGRATAPHWEFYMALAYFKLAIIAAGIAFRARMGGADSPDPVDEAVAPLIAAGLSALRE